VDYKSFELVILTAAMVFLARLFGIQGQHFSIVPELKRLWSKLSDDACSRWDLLAIVVFGTAVTYSFTAPDTERQALAAGLAWTSLVQIGKTGATRISRRDGRRKPPPTLPNQPEKGETV
jgi:hypothetical protein